MIQSMTGYGSGDGVCGGITYRVEVRSVNHRYCEINVRLPDSLARLEQRIRNTISGRFSRGKFDVYISQVDISARYAEPALNIAAITQYQSILKELSEFFNVNFKIKGEIGIADILALKEMIVVQGGDINRPELDEILMKIAGKSVDNLMRMRLKEGEIIYKDLKRRVNRLGTLTRHIEKRVPAVIQGMRRRYVDRVKELSGGQQADMDRLSQEIAVMVERLDITEEIVRVGSHIVQVKEKLDNGIVVGRTIDFLLQEINREVNTIASKSSDVKISQIAVDMKAEIERIREQVQNVE
ncbi:MAG: YicC family protein [Nitrospirae bacterium]|nr:YicC family protein [Nitrospirota bacterium]